MTDDELEKLAGTIEKHAERHGALMLTGDPFGTPYVSAPDLASTIVAAGWRPPARIVTTVQELDALSMGTVIMEGDHGTPDDTGWGFKTMPGVFHRFPDGWHVVAGIGEHAPDLPAIVLWEPEEGE